MKKKTKEKKSLVCYNKVFDKAISFVDLKHYSIKKIKYEFNINKLFIFFNLTLNYFAFYC